MKHLALESLDCQPQSNILLTEHPQGPPKWRERLWEWVVAKTSALWALRGPAVTLFCAKKVVLLALWLCLLANVADCHSPEGRNRITYEAVKEILD